jgi:HTH-type transcriptional regulator / antitoxin HipB
MSQLLNSSPQLAHILKTRRSALGLTQQALATKLAITQNRVSQIETNPGTLGFERLLELFNLLGLDLIVQDRKPAKKVDW